MERQTPERGQPVRMGPRPDVTDDLADKLSALLPLAHPRRVFSLSAARRGGEGRGEVVCSLPLRIGFPSPVGREKVPQEIGRAHV